MTRTVLQIRDAMCLEIAEALEAEFRLRTDLAWDNDRAAAVIRCRLPLTYAEAELEWEKLKKDYPDDRPAEPRPPGLGTRLREVLGMDKDANLKQVLEEAIRRLTP